MCVHAGERCVCVGTVPFCWFLSVPDPHPVSGERCEEPEAGPFTHHPVVKGGIQIRRTLRVKNMRLRLPPKGSESKGREGRALFARLAHPGFSLLPSGRCHLRGLEGNAGCLPELQTPWVYGTEARRARQTDRSCIYSSFVHLSVGLFPFLLGTFLLSFCYFLLCLSTSSFTEQPQVLFFSVS